MPVKADTKNPFKEPSQTIPAKEPIHCSIPLHFNHRFPFEVGDLVMVLDKTDNKTKFDPRWRGPFLVIEKRYTAYRLKHPRHINPYPGLFAPDHLKLYHPRAVHLQQTEVPVKDPAELALITLRARRGRPAVATVEF